MGYTFTEATYLTLRSYLLNDDEKTRFDGFFDQDKTTGNYICTDYENYYAFVQEIGENPSDSPFLAWDGFVNGKSQGAGDL